MLVQPEESDLGVVPDEDEDPFWISDDVPGGPILHCLFMIRLIQYCIAC